MTNPDRAWIGELIELMPTATVVVNAGGQILLANRLLEKLFGYQPRTLSGLSIEDLLPERFREEHVLRRERYLAKPTTRPMGSRYEFAALCADGREFPAEIALHPMETDDGPLILATVRNITRRKVKERRLRRSRQQLRELSQRLITVNDDQRAHLSRVIHDELGQLLTGLKMDLAWLRRHLEDDQEALLEKVAEMGQLLDTGINSVRTLATDLRPGILDDLGLEAAVEWQLQDFERRAGIRCTLDSDMQDCNPDSGCATAAFCILKEALTNVARHAQASQVAVRLNGDAGSLKLEVRDDGRGITRGEIHDPGALGLLGMRERARMQVGTIHISGASGQGSTVTLQLPLVSKEGK